MFAIALWDRAGGEAAAGPRPPRGQAALLGAAPERGSSTRASRARSSPAVSSSRTPDPRALLDYLTLQYVPPPRSGFAGIRKLAPGELLVHEAQRDPDRALLASRLLQARCDQPRRRRWSGSTRCWPRRPAIVWLPTSRSGAFLSGGIDSSLVVAYMAEASSDVKTFSIDFPEAGFSEGEHARRVAAIYGTEHEDRVLEPAMVPLIADAVRHAGEPFADSSAIPTLLLSRMTKERVTVALSGDGGDEAFAGYQRYLAAGNGRAERGAARLLAKSGALSLLPARAERLRRGAHLRALSATERYATLMSHFTPADLARLCTPSFLAERRRPRRGLGGDAGAAGPARG